ncbi:hypothetical protein [Shinella sp. WSJ-2]|uniref:DUF6894 family protein n=1 Tax=Shinella sp. WSJ-2 TaxID=2303749 RepID=UPI001FE1BAEB|nr:hypothetical protein [Shinella sp. WSJ-2]
MLSPAPAKYAQASGLDASRLKFFWGLGQRQGDHAEHCGQFLISRTMPRFYFHIRDGDVHEIDPDGLEFASLEDAVVDARKAAREMLAEKLIANEHIDGQRFEIADETGNVVETVPFKSVLRLN